MGKREFRILLFMRSIWSSSKSPRSQLQQANEWADQAQREKNKLVWRIGDEKWTLPRKPSKRLPRN